MALAHDSRHATRDVDALLKLHTVADILALVRDVFPEEEPQLGSGSSLKIFSVRATEP